MRSSHFQPSFPLCSPKNSIIKTLASISGGTYAVQRDAKLPKLFFSQTAKPKPKVTRQGAPSSSAKKAVSPGCVAVFQHLGSVYCHGVVYPRRKPQLVCVFKPHVSRAAVGGNIAEAPVCQDAAPDSGRQRAVYIKRKAPVIGVLVPHRGRAASYSLCKTPRAFSNLRPGVSSPTMNEAALSISSASSVGSRRTRRECR